VETRSVRWAVALLTCLTLAIPGVTLAKKREEPQQITVQHILIGFKGSVEGKGVTRSKKQAQALAEELLARAQAGEEFDPLVLEYTNDSHPGIYTLTNHGAPLKPNAAQRKQMVRRFGDIAFGLAAGEVGLAKYSVTESPYGWHIIKRLE